MATFIRPTGDQGSDELVLASCAELPCANARLSHVRNAPGADGSVGRELLALAVDPVDGHLAIAYWDRRKEVLWLGGCPDPACSRPVLSPVDLPAPPEGPLQGGRISLVATAHGPVAVTVNRSANQAMVTVCEDAACSSWHQRDFAAPGGAPKLAVSSAGGAVVTAAVGWKTRLVLLGLSSAAIADGSETLLPAPDGADLIGMTVDQRGAPRLLLRTPAGLVLMTCADPQCRA